MIREDVRDDAVPFSQVAETAYSHAIADFYHPPLPTPVIEFDLEASSFFYIDSGTWTIHLNTAGVPAHLDSIAAEPYLRSISQHEIQHYLICPYDGVMNGMMFAAARRHVNDATAMFVCNLFADLVVDSALLRRFLKITHDRIMLSIHESAIRVTEHSPIWLLIVACYRAMWGFPFPPSVKVDDETYEAAEAIVEVARKHIDREARWPKAVSEIAKIVANWRPPDGEQLPGCGGFAAGGSSSDESDEDAQIVLVPADVDAIMGSPVEDRNGELARKCLDSDSTLDQEAEMERLAVEVEQRGGNLEDLEAVYILAGIGDPRAAWIRFWYRAKVKGLLRFDVTTPATAGSTPLTPQVWRLGDPIEELDIVQSLQAFPVLIPNMSTRRWLSVSMPGEEHSRSLPDMLIVIDSSGSMTYSMSSKSVSGAYHKALVAAFAAMEYAFSRGRRVATINFSSGIKRCDWTRDRREVEKRLLVYQGGGTVAPIKEIMLKCNSAETDVMVLMMTDAEIANWDKLVKQIRQLVNRGHKFFMFHIGASSRADENKTHNDLRSAGGNVFPVGSVKDLVGLVVREVRGVYHPSS